jgi:hypothetical protein
MWPLRNASLLARIIATLALGTVLREFVRGYMGPNAWPFPFLLSQTAVSVAGVLVVPANLAIVGVSLGVLCLLFLLFERPSMARRLWPRAIIRSEPVLWGYGSRSSSLRPGYSRQCSRQSQAFWSHLCVPKTLFELMT